MARLSIETPIFQLVRHHSMDYKFLGLQPIPYLTLFTVTNGF